jgi:hypothetical protein
MDPIYCSLAFASASINSYGEYIPCCNIRTDEWNMYKDRDVELSSILNQKSPEFRINAGNLRKLRRQLIRGEWPSACQNCKIAEDAGTASMRTIWNRSLPQDLVPINEYVDNQNIYYLDLTFGTTCNSKCMTCSPDLSDFWEEEYNYIWGTKRPKQLKRICIDSSTTKELVDSFPNVRHISFIGGEPTISDEHIELLQLLIDNNRSKNINLNYITNLTGITNDLIALWSNFKSVNISVSIDGYELVNEYIRYPFKWNKVETNLKKCLDLFRTSLENPNSTLFTVGLSSTISVFNAIQSMNLLEFWFNLSVEYNTDSHMLGCFVNRVSHPTHCQPQILSPQYRQQGIYKGKQLLETIEKHRASLTNKLAHQGLVDSIKLVISWLSEPQINDEQCLQKLKMLILKSDNYRDRDIKNYIPELWDELNTLWDKK